jgi:hypothetical protein
MASANGGESCLISNGAGRIAGNRGTFDVKSDRKLAPCAERVRIRPFCRIQCEIEVFAVAEDFGMQPTGVYWIALYDDLSTQSPFFHSRTVSWQASAGNSRQG